ncbi:MULTISPECIES: type II secretion system secretin GspD [Methylobacterium]|uniref:type II secretion system secretin GspD n=1 Tax=Methylobacterium TaxID=407 RepID=UPI0014050DC6|nr:MULTISPECIES: type II secretion system secretin GspD [Methylobacterium]MDR7039560.1 general secretion pathway protein D [Methylobacterium sp. BE186]
MPEWAGRDPAPALPDDGKRRLGASPRTPDPAAPGAPDKTRIGIGSGKFYGEPRPARPPAESAAGTHTLNLVDASIQEAAAAVLGDILGVNYTIDPKLEGKLTLQTTHAVTKAGATELFESALRNVGGALARSGNVVRVVPAEQATAGGRIGMADRGGPSGVGNAVKVLPLRYVAAAEMKRLLEPIASYGGVVRIDPSRNALLLSGTDQEIAAMREAASVFDVNYMKGMSFALVPVRSLDPEEVVENLSKAFATNGEGAMSGMVQFIPNKRLKSVLVISKQPEYLLTAKSWIRNLDGVAGGRRKEFFTYVLRNRQAKDVVDVLNAMFSDETAAREVRSARSARTGLGDGPGNGAPLGNGNGNGFGGDAGPGGFSVGGGSQFGGGGLGGGGFGGGGIAVGGGFGAGGTGLSGSERFLDGPLPRVDENGSYRSAGIGAGDNGEPRIKIVADPSQNALLILAAESDYRRVERVLANLDVLPNQVLIEATIAEVQLNDDLRLGVRWFFQNRNGSRSGTFSDLVSGAVGSAFPGFSFVARAAGGQVTLNALNDVTRVDVLASPSLMVLDRRTAVLQIGDQVPIQTQSAQSILTPGAPVVNSIAYKDTGVILSVTPRVSESGRVLLDIEQEVSTVQRTTSSNIDSPSFGRRKVRTTVVVNNGESITLGGLIQDRTTIGETRVPVLGDLPIIGNAFKEKQNLVEKTELIIMLTPRVVRDLNEAAAVTDEYRNRVRSVMPTRDPVQRLMTNVKRSIE